ncbi:hypothetical protein BP6252_10446 [Coleophoma cylindrospora]|uniref:Cupin type-2 domain-containing protein n=1 Tax=Coleophoma cylindrospora TaxID=1849047 RepID=A0A3D8QSM3_9HELO|nr:hypothetical protein BP6252_10446 [Coleophoma cylindrospora]
MVKIAKPLVTNADDSPAFWQIGNLWQIMATGVQTDNAFTLLDQIVHVGDGGGPITHTHTQDEGLYIISGKCTFNAGGHQGLQGTPGTFVSIPGNTEHSFTVDEPDTHVLNFYLPAGFEQLLIGIAHPATVRGPQPTETIVERLPPKWLADKLCEDYGQDNIFGNPFCDRPDPAKMLTKPTPGATLFPYTAKAEDLNHYMAMGGCWTILASGEQTGGCYTFLEVLWRIGLVIPARMYKDKDEMIYVLDGHLKISLGNRTVDAKKGTFVYIPSSTVYSVEVTSSEAHCLNLHTRSGFEEVVKFRGTKLDGRPMTLAGDIQDKVVEERAEARLVAKIGLVNLSAVVF